MDIFIIFRGKGFITEEEKAALDALPNIKMVFRKMCMGKQCVQPKMATLFLRDSSHQVSGRTFAPVGRFSSAKVPPLQRLRYFSPRLAGANSTWLHRLGATSRSRSGGDFEKHYERVISSRVRGELRCVAFVQNLERYVCFTQTHLDGNLVVARMGRVTYQERYFAQNI